MKRQLTRWERVEWRFHMWQMMWKYRIHRWWVYHILRRRGTAEEFIDLALPGYGLRNSPASMRLEVWFRPLNLLVAAVNYSELYFRKFAALDRMKDRVFAWEDKWQAQLDEAFPNRDNTRMSTDA